VELWGDQTDSYEPPQNLYSQHAEQPGLFLFEKPSADES